MVEALQDASFPQEKESPFVTITVRQFVFVVIIGLLVGALTWALTSVIETYVLHPLMCRDANAASCSGVTLYSEVLASIIASGVGLFGLVRLQIFRPLLIALSSVISLWGIVEFTTGIFPWYGVLLVVAGLYAVSYGAYMWITRIRLFIVTVLLLIALIVTLRLLFA